MSNGKISTQPQTLNYICITVILTQFQKLIESESQNACIINEWGCAEILPSVVLKSYAYQLKEQEGIHGTQARAI